MNGIIHNTITGDWDKVEVDDDFKISDLTIEQLETLDCYLMQVSELEFTEVVDYFKIVQHYDGRFEVETIKNSKWEKF